MSNWFGGGSREGWGGQGSSSSVSSSYFSGESRSQDSPRSRSSTEQMESEIRSLLEAGTRPEVLYEMFPPPLVDRALKQREDRSQHSGGGGSRRSGDSRGHDSRRRYSDDSRSRGDSRRSRDSRGGGGSQGSRRSWFSGSGGSRISWHSSNASGEGGSQGSRRSWYSRGSPRSQGSRRSWRSGNNSQESRGRYSDDSRRQEGQQYSDDSRRRYSDDSRRRESEGSRRRYSDGSRRQGSDGSRGRYSDDSRRRPSDNSRGQYSDDSRRRPSDDSRRRYSDDSRNRHSDNSRQQYSDDSRRERHSDGGGSWRSGDSREEGYSDDSRRRYSDGSGDRSWGSRDQSPREGSGGPRNESPRRAGDSQGETMDASPRRGSLGGDESPRRDSGGSASQGRFSGSEKGSRRSGEGSQGSRTGSEQSRDGNKSEGSGGSWWGGSIESGDRSRGSSQSRDRSYSGSNEHRRSDHNRSFQSEGRSRHSAGSHSRYSDEKSRYSDERSQGSRRSYRSEEGSYYSGGSRSYYSRGSGGSSEDSVWVQTREDINRLLKLGTDRAVVEEMFSPEELARALRDQERGSAGDSHSGSFRSRGDPYEQSGEISRGSNHSDRAERKGSRHSSRSSSSRASRKTDLDARNEGYNSAGNLSGPSGHSGGSSFNRRHDSSTGNLSEFSGHSAQSEVSDGSHASSAQQGGRQDNTGALSGPSGHSQKSDMREDRDPEGFSLHSKESSGGAEYDKDGESLRGQQNPHHGDESRTASGNGRAIAEEDNSSNLQLDGSTSLPSQSGQVVGAGGLATSGRSIEEAGIGQKGLEGDSQGNERDRSSHITSRRTSADQAEVVDPSKKAGIDGEDAGRGSESDESSDSDYDSSDEGASDTSDHSTNGPFADSGRGSSDDAGAFDAQNNDEVAGDPANLRRESTDKEEDTPEARVDSLTMDDNDDQTSGSDFGSSPGSPSVMQEAVLAVESDEDQPGRDSDGDISGSDGDDDDDDESSRLSSGSSAVSSKSEFLENEALPAQGSDHHRADSVDQVAASHGEQLARDDQSESSSGSSYSSSGDNPSEMNDASQVSPHSQDPHGEESNNQGNPPDAELQKAGQSQSDSAERAASKSTLAHEVQPQQDKPSRRPSHTDGSMASAHESGGSLSASSFGGSEKSSQQSPHDTAESRSINASLESAEDSGGSQSGSHFSGSKNNSEHDLSHDDSNSQSTNSVQSRDSQLVCRDIGMNKSEGSYSDSYVSGSGEGSKHSLSSHGAQTESGEDQSERSEVSNAPLHKEGGSSRSDGSHSGSYFSGSQDGSGDESNEDQGSQTSDSNGISAQDSEASVSQSDFNNESDHSSGMSSAVSSHMDSFAVDSDHPKDSIPPKTANKAIHKDPQEASSHGERNESGVSQDQSVDSRGSSIVDDDSLESSSNSASNMDSFAVETEHGHRSTGSGETSNMDSFAVDSDKMYISSNSGPSMGSSAPSMGSFAGDSGNMHISSNSGFSSNMDSFAVDSEAPDSISNMDSFAAESEHPLEAQNSALETSTNIHSESDDHSAGESMESQSSAETSLEASFAAESAYDGSSVRDAMLGASQGDKAEQNLLASDSSDDELESQRKDEARGESREGSPDDLVAIKQLFDAGTDRSVLEEMFPHAQVAQALASQAAEMKDDGSDNSRSYESGEDSQSQSTPGSQSYQSEEGGKSQQHMSSADEKQPSDEGPFSKDLPDQDNESSESKSGSFYSDEGSNSQYSEGSQSYESDDDENKKDTNPASRKGEGSHQEGRAQGAPVESSPVAAASKDEGSHDSKSGSYYSDDDNSGSQYSGASQSYQSDSDVDYAHEDTPPTARESRTGGPEQNIGPQNLVDEDSHGWAADQDEGSYDHSNSGSYYSDEGSGSQYSGSSQSYDTKDNKSVEGTPAPGDNARSTKDDDNNEMAQDDGSHGSKSGSYYSDEGSGSQYGGSSQSYDTKDNKSVEGTPTESGDSARSTKDAEKKEVAQDDGSHGSKSGSYYSDEGSGSQYSGRSQSYDTKDNKSVERTPTESGDSARSTKDAENKEVAQDDGSHGSKSGSYYSDEGSGSQYSNSSHSYASENDKRGVGTSIDTGTSSVDAGQNERVQNVQDEASSGPEADQDNRTHDSDGRGNSDEESSSQYSGGSQLDHSEDDKSNEGPPRDTRTPTKVPQQSKREQNIPIGASSELAKDEEDGSYDSSGGSYSSDQGSDEGSGSEHSGGSHSQQSTPAADAGSASLDEEPQKMPDKESSSLDGDQDYGSSHGSRNGSSSSDENSDSQCSQGSQNFQSQDDKIEITQNQAGKKGRASTEPDQKQGSNMDDFHKYHSSDDIKHDPPEVLKGHGSFSSNGDFSSLKSEASGGLTHQIAKRLQGDASVGPHGKQGVKEDPPSASDESSEDGSDESFNGSEESSHQKTAKICATEAKKHADHNENKPGDGSTADDIEAIKQLYKAGTSMDVLENMFGAKLIESVLRGEEYEFEQASSAIAEEQNKLERSGSDISLEDLSSVGSGGSHSKSTASLPKDKSVASMSSTRSPGTVDQGNTEDEVGFYQDEDGVTYFVDKNGVERYPDEEPDSEDESGFYEDEYGITYFLDEDGVEHYQDRPKSASGDAGKDAALSKGTKEDELNSPVQPASSSEEVDAKTEMQPAARANSEDNLPQPPSPSEHGSGKKDQMDAEKPPEDESGFYEDEGITYFLDKEGVEHYPNQEPEDSEDESGFYEDEFGVTYFLDKHGTEHYKDDGTSRGRRASIAESFDAEEQKTAHKFSKAERAIRDLDEAGTDRAVLETMFNPKDVARVLDASSDSEDDGSSGSAKSVATENQDTKMDGGNKVQFDGAGDHDADQNSGQRSKTNTLEESVENEPLTEDDIEAIRNLSKAGTARDVLDSMFTPDHVASVLGKEGQEPTVDAQMSDSRSQGSDASDDSQIRESIRTIKNLNKAGTDPSVLKSMFSPTLVKRALAMKEPSKQHVNTPSRLDSDGSEGSEQSFSSKEEPRKDEGRQDKAHQESSSDSESSSSSRSLAAAATKGALPSKSHISKSDSDSSPDDSSSERSAQSEPLSADCVGDYQVQSNQDLIEEEAGFYEDEDGVTYFLDKYGIEHYQNQDPGDPEEESGFYEDDFGVTYFLDKDGMEHYRDDARPAQKRKSSIKGLNLKSLGNLAPELENSEMQQEQEGAEDASQSESQSTATEDNVHEMGTAAGFDDDWSRASTLPARNKKSGSKTLHSEADSVSSTGAVRKKKNPAQRFTLDSSDSSSSEALDASSSRSSHKIEATNSAGGKGSEKVALEANDLPFQSFYDAQPDQPSDSECGFFEDEDGVTYFLDKDGIEHYPNEHPTDGNDETGFFEDERGTTYFVDKEGVQHYKDGEIKPVRRQSSLKGLVQNSSVLPLESPGHDMDASSDESSTDSEQPSDADDSSTSSTGAVRSKKTQAARPSLKPAGGSPSSASSESASAGQEPQPDDIEFGFFEDEDGVTYFLDKDGIEHYPNQESEGDVGFFEDDNGLTYFVDKNGVEHYKDAAIQPVRRQSSFKSLSMNIATFQDIDNNAINDPNFSSDSSSSSSSVHSAGGGDNKTPPLLPTYPSVPNNMEQPASNQLVAPAYAQQEQPSESECGFFEDEDGVTYFLDRDGTEHYPNQESGDGDVGFYQDEKGLTYFVDKNGVEHYKDDAIQPVRRQSSSKSLSMNIAAFQHPDVNSAPGLSLDASSSSSSNSEGSGGSAGRKAPPSLPIDASALDRIKQPTNQSVTPSFGQQEQPSESECGFFEDEDGVTYFLDRDGTEHYPNGTREHGDVGFYQDEKGLTYFVDKNGVEHYKDDAIQPVRRHSSSKSLLQNFAECSHADSGQSMAQSSAPAEASAAGFARSVESEPGFFEDAEGVPYYVDKDGTEYYLNSEDGEYYSQEQKKLVLPRTDDTPRNYSDLFEDAKDEGGVSLDQKPVSMSNAVDLQKISGTKKKPMNYTDVFHGASEGEGVSLEKVPASKTMEQKNTDSPNAQRDDDIRFWLDQGTPLTVVENMYGSEDVARVLQHGLNSRAGKSKTTAQHAARKKGKAKLREGTELTTPNSKAKEISSPGNENHAEAPPAAVPSKGKGKKKKRERDPKKSEGAGGKQIQSGAKLPAQAPGMQSVQKGKRGGEGKKTPSHEQPSQPEVTNRGKEKTLPLSQEEKGENTRKRKGAKAPKMPRRCPQCGTLETEATNLRQESSQRGNDKRKETKSGAEQHACPVCQAVGATVRELQVTLDGERTERPKQAPQCLLCDTVEARVQDLQAALNEMKSRNRSLEKRLSDTQSSKDELESRLEGEVDSLRNQNRLLAKENKKLEKKVDKLKKKSEKRREELESAENRLSSSSSEQQTLKDRLKRVLATSKKQRAVALNNKKVAAAQIQTIRTSLKEAQEEIVRLTGKNESYAGTLSLLAEKGAAYANELQEANKRNETSRTENGVLAEGLDKSLHQQEKLQLSINSMEDAWKRREEELIEKLEDETADKMRVLEEMGQLEETLDITKTHVEELNGERDELMSEIARIQDVANNRKQLLLDVNDQLRDAAVENLELLGKSEQSSKRSELTTAAMRGLEATLEEKNMEILDLNQNVEALKDDLARAYEEIWTSEQEQNEMADRVRELDIRAGKFDATLAEVYEDLDAAMAENQELKSSLQQSMSDCREMLQAKERAESSLKATEENIQSFHDILNETKEDLHHLSTGNKSATDVEMHNQPSPRGVRQPFPARRYYIYEEGGLMRNQFPPAEKYPASFR